jgi:hypothetical protein
MVTVELSFCLVSYSMRNPHVTAANNARIHTNNDLRTRDTAELRHKLQQQQTYNNKLKRAILHYNQLHRHSNSFLGRAPAAASFLQPCNGSAR